MKIKLSRGTLNKKKKKKLSRGTSKQIVQSELKDTVLKKKCFFFFKESIEK